MLLYTDGYVAVLLSCFVIGVVALANINENLQNPWYKCDGDNIQASFQHPRDPFAQRRKSTCARIANLVSAYTEKND